MSVAKRGARKARPFTLVAGSADRVGFVFGVPDLADLPVGMNGVVVTVDSSRYAREDAAALLRLLASTLERRDLSELNRWRRAGETQRLAGVAHLDDYRVARAEGRR